MGARYRVLAIILAIVSVLLFTVASCILAPSASFTITPSSGVTVGELITLDGSASSDPQGRALDYCWTLSGPFGSVAVLSASTGAKVTFKPDVAGSYKIALEVTEESPSRPTDQATQSLVVGTPNLPAIALSPTTLSFSAAAGGADPAAKTVAVSNSGADTLSGLSTDVTYDGATGWLSVSLDTTAAPATLTVQPSTGSLQVGSYAATVSISATGTGNSPQTVAVSFSVTALPAPTAVTVSQPTTTTLLVSWDPVAEATGYRAYRDTDPAGSFTTQVYSAVDTCFTDSGLAPGTTYYYEVKAVNSRTSSPPASAVPGTTIAVGSVNITFDVDPSFQDIGFSSTAVSVVRGTTLTLSTSNTALAATNGWQWYIENTLQNGQTASTFSWDTRGVTPGQYNVNAAVTYDGIGYSGSLRVTVTY